MKLEALPVLRPWSHSVAVAPGMRLRVGQKVAPLLEIVLTAGAGTLEHTLAAQALVTTPTTSPNWWAVTAGAGSDALRLSVEPERWREFMSQCRRLQADAMVDDLPW